MCGLDHAYVQHSFVFATQFPLQANTPVTGYPFNSSAFWGGLQTSAHTLTHALSFSHMPLDFKPLLPLQANTPVTGHPFNSSAFWGGLQTAPTAPPPQHVVLQPAPPLNTSASAPSHLPASVLSGASILPGAHVASLVRGGGNNLTSPGAQVCALFVCVCVC